MSQPPSRCLDSCLEQGVLVLTIIERKVQGEEMASQLRQEMLAALAEAPTANVVVDFQHTEYISSVAFWPLLSLYRKLMETGGRLTVCGLSKTVGDVFFTTRLIQPGGSFGAPFGLEPDRASAISRLTGRSAADSPNATA
jgi:anti-anti-sigma factor